jgi:hypothetical protein
LIDKSERTDGTLSRSDLAYDPERNFYVCPGGKELKKYHRSFSKPATWTMMLVGMGGLGLTMGRRRHHVDQPENRV